MNCDRAGGQLSPVSFYMALATGDPKPELVFGRPRSGRVSSDRGSRTLVRGPLHLSLSLHLFFSSSVRLIDLTVLFKPSDQNQHSPP